MGRTEEVSAAIADQNTRPEELLELLCEMMESFVVLVTSGPQIESKRLLFARAEVERTAGLDALHESGMRHMFQPCLGLVGRLFGKPTDDPEMVFRTLALIGQLLMFCHDSTARMLKTPELDEASVRTIQRLLREHTQAIFRPNLPGVKSV